VLPIIPFGSKRRRFGFKRRKNDLSLEHRAADTTGIGFRSFVVYNIYIKACPDGCNIQIFADDTLIYASGDVKS